VGTVIPPPPVVDPGHSSGASPTQTISPHRGKQLADDWQLRRDQDEIALIIALLD
jgi:hypothetical protein